MSIWAFRCSSVAYRWRMSLTVMSISAAESFSWESWDLPPVASHRYCGMSPKQMIAVFSDSTRAMGLSRCCGRRCSPKRHWVSCQDSSRVPVFLRRLWTQLILNLVNGIDRISENKISATVLRKFVNTVYDILRDVKF